MKKLAMDAFCSWVGAYNEHRGELKKIFVVKKIHLGHAAKSFGLKEQPSLVGRVQPKKRKQQEKKKRKHLKGESSQLRNMDLDL
jgi:ATP-dependent RNA helicase DDX31/DBP7